MARKLLCPQCKIGNYYVTNESGDRRLVYIMPDFTLIPTKENETLEGFDLSVVFCLGCSWSGSPRKAVRY